MIKLKGVSKRFKNETAIDYHDLEFVEGKSYMLLGASGCGKSTLIKCILSHVGYVGSIIKSSNRVSYCPEKVVFPDFILVKVFLEQILKINKINNEKGISLLQEYIKLFQLDKHLNKNICELSKGNKQKINLIQSLIVDSDIYIFDEPLSGLDEKIKEVFINEIRKLRRKRKLILISTHHLKDFNFKVKNLIYLFRKEDNNV